MKINLHSVRSSIVDHFTSIPVKMNIKLSIVFLIALFATGMTFSTQFFSTVNHKANIF